MVRLMASRVLGGLSCSLGFVSPDGVAGAERFDHDAVGLDQMNSAVFVASPSQSVGVFPTVVDSTERECVGLVRFSVAGGVFVDVVNVAAPMPPADREQLCCFSCFAGHR